MGKIRTPHFRIVVSDSRAARNSRAIEEIGRYSPGSEPSQIEVTSDRAQYWLSVGAQPTEAVAALLKITGDWQKFKGLPGSSKKWTEIGQKKAVISDRSCCLLTFFTFVVSLSSRNSSNYHRHSPICLIVFPRLTNLHPLSYSLGASESL